MEAGLIRKAELLHGGAVRFLDGYDFQNPAPESYVGPKVAVFTFDKHKVKLPISEKETGFDLVIEENGSLSIEKNGDLYIERVNVKPVIRNCPDQAFINLSHPCVYGCAHGVSPLICPNNGTLMTASQVAEELESTGALHRFKSVSFSSGIVGDPGRTVDAMAVAVAVAREMYPKMNIGVEAYITDVDQLVALKDAGANEIKINVECARRDIFEAIYPEYDYDLQFSMLKEAGAHFKKGRMASNVYFGLGETDQDVDMTMERLCRMNVLPMLKMARYNDYNRERFLRAGVPEEVPTVLRSMFLGGLQKSAMKRHGLEPKKFHTMCFSCQCCDLVPFTDF